MLRDRLPWILFLLAALAFGRVWLIQDVMWDDNYWILYRYESQNLEEYFQSGFYQMQRLPLGIFIYFFFGTYTQTDHFYFVWHALNSLTQIGSPIVLYFFLKNLFPDKQGLSFFAAAALIIFQVDQTLPFASAINYRISLLLSIASLYLTERAFRSDKIQAGKFVGSLVCALLAHSVFLEAAITLEPARALVIFYLIARRTNDGWHSVLRKTLLAWLPYVALCIPIVVYKTFLKPYGHYGHMYDMNLLFFLNFEQNLRTLSYFLLFPWVLQLLNIGTVKPVTWIMGALSFGVLLVALYRTAVVSAICKRPSKIPASSWLSVKREWRSNESVLLLGAVAFFPAAFFFQFVSRPVSIGFDTSHAATAQIGHAILVGWVLVTIYKLTLQRSKREPWLKYLYSAVLAAGVFFSNANLDLYFKSWEFQNQFWNAFISRFPNIPENKLFIFDIDQSALYSDLNNSYSLEFQMNMLYAASEKQFPFRRHFASPVGQWYREAAKTGVMDPVFHKNRFSFTFERNTYVGKDIFDGKDFIFVHYWDNVLSVNKEILDRYPEIPYAVWLDRPFPEVPETTTYPLRYKLRGVNSPQVD